VKEKISDQFFLHISQRLGLRQTLIILDDKMKSEI